MAQYAILMFSKAPADPADLAPEELAAYRGHAEEVEQGTLGASMVAAFALHPSTTATSVRGDVVTDGPFLEAKEVVAGFYVIEAPDPDTALEVARRNPVTQQGGGVEGPARDLLDRGLNRVTAVGEAMADATSTWPRSACRRRTPRRWWPGPATASQATRRPG